jgi:SAM-dependent methyltransferase
MRNKKKYNRLFYTEINERALRSAKIIWPIVIDILPKFHSVVDFGCGEGVWLSVVQQYGIENVKGLDGHWVDKEYLRIDKQNFMEVNFEKSIYLDSKYDLAISLEVAEHLPQCVAKQFIDSLTKVSDYILFSAAIPFQGGTDHFNEQCPEYWNNLFNEKGYVAVDCLRKNIWNNSQISTPYKQNIMIFVKRELMNSIKSSEADFCINHPPLFLIHPDRYLLMVKTNLNDISLLKAFKIIFRRIIINLLGRRVIISIKKCLNK